MTSIKYSIAIRTLGLAPDILRKELESIALQTIQPERVVIYIAHGYAVPNFRICNETYVSTCKGMLTQRAVEYREITSPLILLLDDDVTLSPHSAEMMAKALISGSYDCIGADVFENHKMTVNEKIYSALTNLTFPHTDTRFAFKIHSCGSFSYINRPNRLIMDSQSASGPCSIWTKEALLRIRPHDETWIDGIGFPFNEDTLLFYKLYRNGGKLGILFESGVSNLNARTSSDAYHMDPSRFAKRAKALYIVWHRSVFSYKTSIIKCVWCAIQFIMKSIWMIPVHIIATIIYHDPKIVADYLKGIIEGIAYTVGDGYTSLPPYMIDKYMTNKQNR